MKLRLVRHAAPEVARGLCYGRSDLPAIEGDTQHAAAVLALELPPDLLLRTSPARRCRQLADALAALRPDLRPTVDDRLQEMDFGSWEMQPWDALAGAMGAWMQDFARHRVGGGESVADLLARVGGALASVEAEEAWITHAGVVRAVRWIAASGMALPGTARDWPQEPVGFGALEVREIPAPAALSGTRVPASRG